MAVAQKSATEVAFARNNFSFSDAEAVKAANEVIAKLGISVDDFITHYDCVGLTRDWSQDITAARLRIAAEDWTRERKENRAAPRAAVGFKAIPAAKLSWEDMPEGVEVAARTPAPKRQATDAAMASAAAAPGSLLKGATAALSLSAQSMTPPQHAFASAGGAYGPPRTPLGTPMQTAPTPTAPSTASKFAARQNRGQPACPVLHDTLPTLDAQHATASGPGVGVRPLGAGSLLSAEHHLFMSEPLDTKVHALDERIEDFGAAIAAALPTVAGDILTTSLNDITSSSPVWAVGRIVPEAEGAPLNEASLLLEGCREASGGARVRLDVSHMPHGGAAGMPALRLFPGQCVAVMGLNPTGHTFIAQRVVTHLPAQPRAQAAAVVVDTADAATAGAEPLAEAGAAAAGSAVSSGLSMVVAAGPFTTSDSMAYEPLSDLLAYCTAHPPDVLLLVGPFVDTEHPMVAGGCMERSHEDVYRAEVAARLARWRRTGGQAVGRCALALAPSGRDVTALPVLPQPPMSGEGYEKMGVGAPGSSQLALLQNPCTAAAGPLVFGCASADVLRALSSAELARPAPNTDRLAALASHIIGQRSYFPLFPPPRGTCMDTSHYAALTTPTTPDLLLLPSDLAPFAKLLPLAQYDPTTAAAAGAAAGTPGNNGSSNVDPATGSVETPGGSNTGTAGAGHGVSGTGPSCVVVLNPGRLARGNGGGTFAHVSVSPGTQPVHARTKVEVLRI